MRGLPHVPFLATSRLSVSEVEALVRRCRRELLLDELRKIMSADYDRSTREARAREKAAQIRAEFGRPRRASRAARAWAGDAG
jgi:hypothetical protein